MALRHPPGAWLFLLGSIVLIHACGQKGSGRDDTSSTAHGDGGGGTTNETGTDAGDGDGAQRPTGTDNYDCQKAEGDLPLLKLTEVFAGLDEPIQVLHPPNDERLFIVQRDGKILVADGPELSSTPFLDLADVVISDDDAETYGYSDWALNGVAFHPDFAENGLVFAYFNTMPRHQYAAGDAILAQYRVSADNPNLAELDSEKVLLHIPRDGHIDHHGGGLAFGADGMLYLALGDGNSKEGDVQSADPDGHGQDPETLLGSILRIEPDLNGGYQIPAGNLHEQLPDAAPEVWDYGVRNPFRISFDGCTGTLYITDVGFEAFEEVNIELAGQGHNNYGWPIMEGPECEDSAGCNTSGLVLPHYSYPWLAESKTTIIGGAVYRGAALPALRGKYVFGDFLRNAIYLLTFHEDTQTVSDVVDLSMDLDYPSSPTSISNGADGEIYVTSYFNGSVYRLDPE